MARSNRRVSSSHLLASAASLALLAGLAQAQPTSVLFNGSVNTSYVVPANWNGGIVPNNGGGIFYAPIIGVGLTSGLLAGSVQVDAAQLNDNSRLRLSPNTTFRVRGSTSAIGSGTFSILTGAQLEMNQAGGGVTDLILEGSGPVIFGSGVGTPGRVLMSNSINNRIYSSTATNTLLNELTIEGSGQIGLGQTPVDNRGVIRATTSSGLILQPGGGGTQNRGTVEGDGGTLVVRDALTNITVGPLTGTIRAVNGGIVQVEGSINGGLLQTAFATSVIRSNAGTIVNATLDNAIVEVPTANNLRIQGTFPGTPSSEFRLRQSGGGFCDLIVTGLGTTTISGPQIVATAATNNRIYSESGAATFALAGGSSYRGGGQIGFAQTTLVFDAGSIVSADAASLFIHAGGGGTDNNGTLEARNGGTLSLRGSIDNATGLVQALAGSIVDLDGCTLTGGTLRSLGTGVVLVDATVPLVSNILLDQGEIRTTPSNALRIAGTNIINGSLTLNQAGGGTCDLRTQGDVTLNGTGQLRTNAAVNNRVYSESGAGTLTLNLPFRGAGQIGVNQTTLIFNSLVDNDTTGTLVIGAGAGGTDNNSIIRQSGSGLTQLQNGFTNQQGRLEVTGAGNLDLDGCSLTGGILADTGAGTFIVDNSAPTLQDITLESGEITITPSNALRIAGTNIINGSLTLNQAGGGICDLRAQGDVTLNGTGQLRTNAAVNNRVYSESGAGTLTLNLPFRGAGQIGVNQTTLIFNSLVDNDTTGTLVIGAGAGGTDNNSIIRQSGSGLTQLQNGFTNQQGRLEVTGAGNLDLDGCNLIGGTLADTGDGSFYVDGGVPLLQSITLESGDVVIGPSAQARFTGVNTIAGNLRVTQSGGGFSDISAIGTDNTTFNGPGQINLTNNANNRIYSESGAGSITFGPSLTVRGSGQIGVGLSAVTNRGLILSDLSVGLTIATNAAGFVNEGEVRVSGLGSILSNSGNFTQAAGLIQIDAGRLFNRSAGSIVQTGGTILANGELQVVSDNYQLQGGTLAGDGLVDSIVTQTGGTIDPRPSLTIEGGLTQNANSTLRIDLNGTGSNDADLVSVTGPAALNGTLRVVIGTNYVITPGDQFVILNSTGARTGTFSSLVVEPAQLGIDASLQYFNNSVVLTIDGCVICGYCNYDYNRDENVDLLDAQQMAQVFVGLIQPEANWLDGDLNLDENADLTDAQLLARAIVQGLCEL